MFIIIKVPGFLRLRTLAAKYSSMVLANMAGLPLGAEGPMIHMGALTGNAISQAQSKELGFKISLKMIIIIVIFYWNL